MDETVNFSLTPLLSRSGGELSLTVQLAWRRAQNEAFSLLRLHHIMFGGRLVGG